MNCPRCARGIPDDALLCCYCGRVIVRKKPAKVHQRPNGSGTAYKDGSTWTARVTVGWWTDAAGKKHQKRKKKRGFATRAEALAYCPILMYGPGGPERKAPILEHYWKTYESGELEKLSVSKQVAYRGAWKKLSALKDRPVDRLTVAELRAAVEAKSKSYYTARDMKVVLGHLFDLAGADGFASKDLPDYIILPEREEKERQPFTEDEQKALWKAYDAGDRRAAIPLIMIYTGMMPGEIQGLQKTMVDLDARKITGAGMKTKVRRASAIYLPESIVPVLAAELEQAPPGPYVWRHNEKVFYADFHAVLRDTGCRPLTPYSCRHTTATALAITENIAPQTIKKLMRWSTTRMLDRYAHPDDADVLAAADTLKRADTAPEQTPDAPHPA